jgi:pentatricopeptide repeat protein
MIFTFILCNVLVIALGFILFIFFQPARKEYGLMITYYSRRGDMHRARQTFESMRARGIEPSSHVYSR